MEKFFVGMHRIDKAWKFDRTFISAARLWDRVSPFIGCDEWVMDSGAFTEIEKFGVYRQGVSPYAELIRTYARANRGLLAAVAQDYMCERYICARVLGLPVQNLTARTAEKVLRELLPARAWVRQIREHQRLTIERYDALMTEDVGGTYIMPVLQGFTPRQYVRHLRAYGDRLAHGAWVGVGSVCKRQGDPKFVAAVLRAILSERPDLRLHGFGIKLTALRDPGVASMLHSADSLAWSFGARQRKGDANSLWVARDYEAQVLDAVGLAPGFNLDMYLCGTRVQDHAERDNAEAGVRREKNQRWNAIWKGIQAEAAENDRINLERANANLRA